MSTATQRNSALRAACSSLEPTLHCSPLPSGIASPARRFLTPASARPLASPPLAPRPMTFSLLSQSAFFHHQPSYFHYHAPPPQHGRRIARRGAHHVAAYVRVAGAAAAHPLRSRPGHVHVAARDV